MSTLQLFWSKTTGAITSFRIEESVKRGTSSHSHDKQKSNHHSGDRKSYELYLSYRFEVGEDSFQGRDKMSSAREKDKLEHLQADKYPVGSSVQVAYNPGNPMDSTLHQAGNGFFAVLWLLATGVGFGAFKLITLKAPEEIPPEDY